MSNPAGDSPGTGWKEVFLNGSKEAEDELIRRQFAPEINRIQRDVSRIEGRSSFKRGQQNKMLACTKKADFEILPGVPEDLRVGLFQPGKKYTAHVRFSNASSFHQPDSVPDLRGVGIRVITGTAKNHDLLMTNAPSSHARDVRQFMVVASAAGRQGRPAMLWRLRAWRTAASLVRITRGLGLKEALRVFRTIKDQTSHPVASLATESYWSRGPFAFGAVAVKFRLQPTTTGESPAADLRAELKSRLNQGEVIFDFQVQRYVDESNTPIEDGTVEWKEQDAAFITIARLVIPRQELDAADESEIDNYAFNPWNSSTDEIRPLGSLNRGRKLVYEASAKLRGGSR